MKRVQYDGPGALLRVAGREIPRGGTAEVPDRDADALADNPRFDVTVTDVPKTGGGGEPEADTTGEGHTDTDPESEEDS